MKTGIPLAGGQKSVGRTLEENQSEIVTAPTLCADRLREDPSSLTFVVNGAPKVMAFAMDLPDCVFRAKSFGDYDPKPSSFWAWVGMVDEMLRNRRGR